MKNPLQDMSTMDFRNLTGLGKQDFSKVCGVAVTTYGRHEQNGKNRKLYASVALLLTNEIYSEKHVLEFLEMPQAIELGRCKDEIPLVDSPYFRSRIKLEKELKKMKRKFKEGDKDLVVDRDLSR